MIKFFRKIRQRLLNENKFSQYLIYAIGEIFLVVIGILIALQINNWNENKKNTKKEIFHLENILSNLRDDLAEEIIPCIEKTEKQIQAYDLLKADFYDKDILTNDSIKRLVIQNLSQFDLVLNTVAFDNLKSIGMDILSNDSIKSQLLTLYGNNYKYVLRLQTKNNEFHAEGVTKLMHDNMNMWGKLTDEDKEYLRNDKQITNRLRTEKYMFQKYLNELKKIEPKSKGVIKNISQEIKQLEEK
jgi:hypothetical protein